MCCPSGRFVELFFCTYSICLFINVILVSLVCNFIQRSAATDYFVYVNYFYSQFT